LSIETTAAAPENTFAGGGRLRRQKVLPQTAVGEPPSLRDATGLANLGSSRGCPWMNMNIDGFEKAISGLYFH
jgi:hypothetical protein